MTDLRSTQVAAQGDVIDFGIGQPDMGLLPTEMIEQAAAHRLSQHNPHTLAYGNEVGDGFFRLALSHFLSNLYGEAVEPSRLVATAGNSQAMDMLCTVLTQAGDTIFVEEPTYFIINRIFNDHHLNVVSLPIDEQGLVVEALEAALQKETPKFLYTIPTFHNPAAVTMPRERRERIVELSQQYGFYVIADEVYQLLNYTAVPPQPFANYIDHDTIISIGSFSKILAPGMRVGWLQAHQDFCAQFEEIGIFFSGGSVSHFSASVVRSMLELGLQDQYLTEIKQIYGRRVAVMDEMLRTHIPEASYIRPDGGFFFWIAFPDSIDVQALEAEAAVQKVGFLAGHEASTTGGLQNYIRLSFAFYDEALIVEGMKRLAAAIANL